MSFSMPSRNCWLPSTVSLSVCLCLCTDMCLFALTKWSLAYRLLPHVTMQQ